MPTAAGPNAIGLPIARAKNAHIVSAENGFVIHLDTDAYSQTIKIAKDATEVAEIISAYFA
jgi:hypothetical protein